MLPAVDNTRILDVGCGKGGPTLELARISGGQVTGLDIDPSALLELAGRAAEKDVSDRIQIVQASMFDIGFADETFDILWAEGSMHVLGFGRALEEWRRCIRPQGFLVAHDMCWLRPNPPSEIANCEQLVYPGIRTVCEYTELIPDYGYDLVGHFVLPEDFWWADHFVPLKARIRELRRKYAGDHVAQSTLDREQRAADLYRAYAHWYGSAFLILQKREP
jgi:SAM-dependent methyltransferase